MQKKIKYSFENTSPTEGCVVTQFALCENNRPKWGSLITYSLPLAEKSNVVDVKSEAQTKRVYHALHEKTTCQRCEYKSSSRRVEGKQVCLYGFSLKLIAGNRLNPLLNRS